ncbi:LysR substrate-binding domain-containing protein [Curvibacter sp. HBC28]|uniref:LysR substrate-binding domain-containing protein n=1 Tax=Curvibacter microcysteis TaxID=3026419 RepID=A0ABT5MB65_9BURK|nr:LysR substrate-binding domain-containing protein [Curvibacter sp. HBC28]MDD0813229.1 LysR substrate-binding domain-containing protein [Curvibacter sp. HBC28]
MEIRQLRYFLDIAETEHLTQSAQNLFVTQSTLSHGLRQLEAELDTSLFDRLGRGLKLSQAGAEFRVYATRALKEIEAGRMALADLSGLQSGRLTIGAIPTFLNTVLPATVAAFCEAYPKVQVEVRDLRAGPIEDQLMSGELDLGIAFHPTRDEEIETEPLFEERMMVVLRKTAPEAHGQHISLKQAAQLPMALLPRSFATRRMLDEKFRLAGVEPRVRVEMESVEALLGVCQHGSLATIVPERASLQMPDLYAMALTAPEVVRHAGLLWRRSASRSVAAREFAAMLRSVHLS